MRKEPDADLILQRSGGGMEWKFPEINPRISSPTHKHLHALFPLLESLFLLFFLGQHISSFSTQVFLWEVGVTPPQSRRGHVRPPEREKRNKVSPGESPSLTWMGWGKQEGFMEAVAFIHLTNSHALLCSRPRDGPWGIR